MRSHLVASTRDGLALYAKPPVALYEKPDPRVQLSCRVPSSVRHGLDEVVRLWRLVAEASGDADEVELIDMTYVVGRLLEVGIDTAFAEFGQKPKSEEGWKELAAQISKAAKNSNKR